MQRGRAPETASRSGCGRFATELRKGSLRDRFNVVLRARGGEAAPGDRVAVRCGRFATELRKGSLRAPAGVVSPRVNIPRNYFRSMWLYALSLARPTTSRV